MGSTIIASMLLSVPRNRGTPYYSMKTLYPRGYLQSRGERHPTPPRGRLRGRHVAREDNILQNISSGSGPHGKVPDPCTCKPDLRVGPGPARPRPGPPGRVSDPSVWGPGRPQPGPGTLGQRIPRPCSSSGRGPMPTRV
jgi:hypothetical protein